MFRKILSCSLLIFYLFAATGVEVRAHFCGNSFQSLSLFGDPEEGCCGDAEKAAGCCHDEFVKGELADDQSVAKIVVPAPTLFLLELPVIVPPTLRVLSPAFKNRSVLVWHGPPRSPSRAIYLTNQVFRI